MVAVLGASFSAFAKPPRLTLFISVDSFGSDVFLRSKPKFKAGLAAMVKDGAVFPTARYDYAETVTAAGHTTLSTGANPSRHGVIANKLMNRATGKFEKIFAELASEQT